MCQFFQIHSENPDARLIKRTAEIINDRGVVVYPTDSAYAIGCQLGDKHALERIRRLRDLEREHNFTLMCRDLSELSTYAKVDNWVYRLLKAHTPGAYTFILQATKEVPARLRHPKRKTIGLRVPDNKITLAILEELGEPMMSCSLILPHQDYPVVDPEDIREQLEKKVDLIIDGGACSMDYTTVVDCTGSHPQVIREGRGDTLPFL